MALGVFLTLKNEMEKLTSILTLQCVIAWVLSAEHSPRGAAYACVGVTNPKHNVPSCWGGGIHYY